MENPDPATQLPETQLPDWIERSQRTALRRYRMGLVKPLATVGILALAALLGWLFWFSLPNPVRWFAGSPSAVASSASRAGQWSMLGHGPNLNGYVAEPERQPIGRLVWTQDLGPYTRSAPLVADGALYVGGYFKAMALDAATGETIWEVETPGPMDHALTVANNNLVYVGLTNHKMLALNKDSGEQAWEFKAHLPISASALVQDGIAYVTSSGNIIYALDAQTGEQLWKHRIKGNVKTTPALRNGRLYAADDEGNLYFIDADKGRRRFRFITAGSASGPPVIGNDAAYFPSGGSLYAISTGVKGLPGLYWIKRTWFQLWIWQVPLVPAPPAQRGEQWRFEPEERASQGVIASPALADGVYYLGDGDGLFYARDTATDAELWRFEAGDGIVSSPVILGERVYFGARDGMLYALNRADGAPIWTLDLGAPIELPPAYSGGRLFVRTADGQAHAVE
jgi:outer membrane protein assembly factor BamB